MMKQQTFISTQNVLTWKKIMELKLNIGYAELLELIKQLPAIEIARLKAALSDVPSGKMPAGNNAQLLQRLLDGPVMSEEQHGQFLENRKLFNAWRTS